MPEPFAVATEASAVDEVARHPAALDQHVRLPVNTKGVDPELVSSPMDGCRGTRWFCTSAGEQNRLIFGSARSGSICVQHRQFVLRLKVAIEGALLQCRSCHCSMQKSPINYQRGERNNQGSGEK
jgi:hypothetical protein